MSTVSIRMATLAAMLMLSGALHAQAPAPTDTAPAPKAAVPGAVPSKGQPDPALMTPQTPAASDPAKSTESIKNGNDATGKKKQKRERGGNFMPANPDASPVLPGQSPTAGTSGAKSGTGGTSSAKTGTGGTSSAKTGTGGTSSAKSGAATDASGTGRTTAKAEGSRNRSGWRGGMQRAFLDYQTKEEFGVYKEKATAVKTYDECKSLLESTKKDLEPRAKAQNKAIDVNPTAVCDRAESNGRLTG
jgi:hypothetical protein